MSRLISGQTVVNVSVACMVPPRGPRRRRFGTAANPALTGWGPAGNNCAGGGHRELKFPKMSVWLHARCESLCRNVSRDPSRLRWRDHRLGRSSGAPLADARLANADLGSADLTNANLDGVTSGGVTATADELPAGWTLERGSQDSLLRRDLDRGAAGDRYRPHHSPRHPLTPHPRFSNLARAKLSGSGRLADRRGLAGRCRVRSRRRRPAPGPAGRAWRGCGRCGS